LDYSLEHFCKIKYARENYFSSWGETFLKKTILRMKNVLDHPSGHNLSIQKLPFELCNALSWYICQLFFLGIERLGFKKLIF
jgi:hypothetical protein